MATPTGSEQQLSTLHSRLHQLQAKERMIYEALASLVRFIKGEASKNFSKINDFREFKKLVLASVLSFSKARKKKVGVIEPKFNVKHYERTIVCACDSTYRDMAVQAASKDLTRDAIYELIASLRQDCQRISRQVKHLAGELRKTRLIPGGVRQLLNNVLEPANEDDSDTAAAQQA